jgi:ribosomal protein S18 acetylase RimI-like enzyme
VSPFDPREVKTRFMTENDVPAVLSAPWAEIPDKDMISSQRGGPFDSSFVAEVGGKLAGFVLARIMFVGRPMIVVCQLQLIAVQPDYLGRGIGSLLIDALHDYCNFRGIHTIRALVKNDDAKLLEYFDRLGFHQSNKVNLDITWG